MEARNFEDEFEQAVADWRSRYRLAEDDAVLLLVELFRLHQRHWDEIRRRELPSFEQFRSDIAKLTPTSRTACSINPRSSLAASGRRLATTSSTS